MWDYIVVCNERQLKEFLNKENIKKWKLFDKWTSSLDTNPKTIYFKIMYWKENK